MESETKSFGEGQGADQNNNEQRESKDRIELPKEDESKTLRGTDFVGTGQNFFQMQERPEDLLKFEEEKEEDPFNIKAKDGRSQLNKINEFDSIIPGIGSRQGGIRQVNDQEPPMGSSLLDDEGPDHFDPFGLPDQRQNVDNTNDQQNNYRPEPSSLAEFGTSNDNPFGGGGGSPTAMDPRVKSQQSTRKMAGSSLANNGNDQQDGGVMVECSNIGEGCPHKQIPIDFLEIHEKFECEYRLVKCTYQGCNLNEPMILKLLQIHQQFECPGRPNQDDEDNDIGNLLSARQYSEVLPERHGQLSGSSSQQHENLDRFEEDKSEDDEDEEEEFENQQNHPATTNDLNQIVACTKCGAQIRQDCMSDHLMAHQFEEDANQEDAQIQMQINMID